MTKIHTIPAIPIDYKIVYAKFLLLGLHSFPNNTLWSIDPLLNTNAGRNKELENLIIECTHTTINYNDKIYYAEDLNTLYTDLIQDVKKYNET